MKTLKLSALC